MICLPWIAEEKIDFINSEDCMGNHKQYYRAWARNTITQRLVCGTGGSKDEARKTLERNIEKCSA